MAEHTQPNRKGKRMTRLSAATSKKKKTALVDLTDMSVTCPIRKNSIEVINISDDEEGGPLFNSSHPPSNISLPNFNHIQSYVNSIRTSLMDTRRIDFKKTEPVPSTSRQQFNHPAPRDLTHEELKNLLASIEDIPKSSSIVEKMTYKKENTAEADVMAFVDSISNVNTDELRKEIDERNEFLDSLVCHSAVTSEEVFSIEHEAECIVDCTAETPPQAEAAADISANHDSTSGKQECPVCLEPFCSDITVMATQCGHIYCGDCMKKILATSKKCPSCRFKLTAKKVFQIFLFK